MTTIKDIFIMCRAYWYNDDTCFHMLCKHCPKDNVCEIQLYAINDLLKAGEYH